VLTLVGTARAGFLLAASGVCGALAIWRRHERWSDARFLVSTGAALLFACFYIVAIVPRNGAKDTVTSAAETKSASPPRHEASPGRTIVVDNRVTSGKRMREDDALARLTTRPVANCASRGCDIPGTERESGGAYDSAVCQRRGESITNGDDQDAADDDNPGLFESTRYYGVRLKASDTFGYISEVWIARQYRGGLGLPAC
jgi:hypothetical protein